jgi:hypothetical protein
LKLRFAPVEYVPGATKVVVSGRVSGVDSGVGVMRIGNVSVDINSATYDKAPSLGSVVLVVGTQPVRHGAVLAEKIYVR